MFLAKIHLLWDKKHIQLNSPARLCFENKTRMIPTSETNYQIIPKKHAVSPNDISYQ